MNADQLRTYWAHKREETQRATEREAMLSPENIIANVRAPRLTVRVYELFGEQFPFAVRCDWAAGYNPDSDDEFLSAAAALRYAAHIVDQSIRGVAA